MSQFSFISTIVDSPNINWIHDLCKTDNESWFLEACCRRPTFARWLGDKIVDKLFYDNVIMSPAHARGAQENQMYKWEKRSPKARTEWPNYLTMKTHHNYARAISRTISLGKVICHSGRKPRPTGQKYLLCRTITSILGRTNDKALVDGPGKSSGKM